MNDRAGTKLDAFLKDLRAAKRAQGKVEQILQDDPLVRRMEGLVEGVDVEMDKPLESEDKDE